MEFDVEDLKGNKQTVKFPIDEGSYTREALIEQLNKKLKENADIAKYELKAEPYGRSIKLGSNKAFVTRFKGNMFKIDDDDGYTSVFYDNVKEGTVEQFPAVFTGGKVLIEDSSSIDAEHKFLVIDETNNKLTLRPNETVDSVTIEIGKGTYSLSGIITELQTKLNEKFKDENNRPLFVVGTTGGENVDVGSQDGSYKKWTLFRGITITTTAKGPASGVNIDKNSSAYDTLFRDRNFLYYGPKADVSKYDTKADKNASFTGSKDLGGISGAGPLTLTAKNNTFRISLKGTDDKVSRTATIELEARDYTSKEDLLQAVNDQLKEKKLDDLIQAKLTANNTLQIVEAAGGDVNGYITVGAANGSNGASETENGYKMLFVKSERTPVPHTESSTGGVCSFETTGAATGSSMKVNVNGLDRDVNISDKTSLDQIAKDITDQLKGFTTPPVDNGFSSRPVAGTTTTTGSFNQTQTVGRDTVNHWSDTQTGAGDPQGIADGKATPAVLTIGPELKDTMHLGKDNNEITLTIGDRTETLQLTDGEEDLTKEQLAARLQEKINQNQAFGTGLRGATVELKGNRLVLTSNAKGNPAKLSCSTGNSSFLRELRTTRSTASCTSTGAMKSSIEITDNTNDKLVIKYRGKGDTNINTVELDLSGGKYTPSTFADEVNTQLKNKGMDGKIKATCDGYNRLALTTTDAGDGVSISFDTGSSTAAGPMFSVTNHTPAYVNTTGSIPNGITIESGKQQFKLQVDNTPDGVDNPSTVTVELTAKTYTTREEFLTELNTQLAGTGVTASLVTYRDPYYNYFYNTLRFETTAAGKGTSVNVTYDDPKNNPASAMQAIYGTTSVTYPSVEAEVKDDKLVLTAKKADGSVDTKASITVKSTTSAGLLESDYTTKETSPTSLDGYHSRIKAAIDGVSFKEYSLDGVDTSAGTVTINRYNKDLAFYVYRNGPGSAYTHYSFALEEKDYTYAELAKALQEKLDAAGSPVKGAMEVTVTTEGGVDIRAKNYGYEHRFTGLSGGFYDKVLSAASTKKEQLSAEDASGTQKVKGAYIIGRKDITGGVELAYGVCDTLSFDLKAKDQDIHIEMTLDEGKYDPEELVKHIQERLDEQLVKNGFRPGLVQVGIGGISSGVAGSNDDRALNFRISDTVQANEAGDYLIDGVGGNAAFEIFYQTEGKVVPAYVMGAKDVRNGVTIREGQTDLSFEVDGKIYEIELMPGEYTAKGIVDELKRAFGDDIPLTASINPDDGRVKISYTELGSHVFGPVTGGARAEVFFNEIGGSDNTYRHIQLSSQVSDRILLKRSEFNARMLRIDSLNIGAQRYAAKAIDRISKAIDRVSVLRIEFGSMQNRLEHAMNNNRNKAENLEHADSVIRDTDMAREISRLATYNMLEQASGSILSQANKKGEIVLSLLG